MRTSVRNNARPHHNMKKYCLLLLLISSSFHLARAKHPDEEKAFKILDQISQHNFQATFTYIHRSSQLELLESFEGGKIAVQGNKYRLTLPGQEVINNGKTVWTYLMDANEVQITDHDPEQEATTPWTIFANYRRDYGFSRFDTHQADGHSYDSVELFAKDTENVLARIRITVARNTKYIKYVEVMDHNQTLHIFFMTDFVYDLTLDKAFFNFNLDDYQDIEVIDMR